MSKWPVLRRDDWQLCEMRTCVLVSAPELDDLRAANTLLRAALKEAMGWDWLTDAPPPKEIVAKCEDALRGVPQTGKSHE